MTTSSISPGLGEGRAPAPGGDHGRGMLLGVVVGSQLMVVLTTNVVNIALPGIRTAFGFSPSGLSWVVNVYMLTFGGLLLLGARSGDILGRKSVFGTGIALLTLGSLVATLAPSAPVFLAALACQGVGAALAEPSSLALLMVTFAEGQERNRALGVFSTVAGIGTAAGMILGGLLTTLSWRYALALNVPIGLVILALTPRFVPRSERHHGRFDVAGALTSTLGMGCLVYALIRALGSGWTDPLTLGAFGAAAVLLVVFLVIETHVSQPIVPLRLFANRERSGAYANTLLVGATVSGLFFYLTQFLQTVLGFSGLKAGTCFLPLAAMMVLSGLTAPRLLPRLGPKVVMLAGAAALGGGALWLSGTDVTTTYLSGLLGPLLLTGIGLGFTIMPLNAIILSRVVRAEAGAASGLQQAMLRIGGSLGLAVLVTVSTPHGPRPSDAAAAHRQLADSVGTAFGHATVFIGCAFLVGLLVLRNRTAATTVARPPAP